jgi:hypothetical protein
MYNLVSQRLNEGVSGPAFYPISEITAALNEANRFFCLLTLGLETTNTWNVPSYSSNGNSPFFHMLTFFPSWIVPLRITTATGMKVRPTSIEGLAMRDSGWNNSPGAPTRYSSSGADFVGLYQQPAAGSTLLNVTFARQPLALINDADVPEIPAEYHPKLVDYAINRMRMAEGGQEFEKSLPLFNSFLDGAKHYGAYVRARNLGSRYDKVPIELEKYDLSKLLKLRGDLFPERKLQAV